MNESKVVQLCKNITKKTALKKLVLNELNLNLDDIEIPAGLEFDSASGEIKAVGSQVKPQRAMD